MNTSKTLIILLSIMLTLSQEIQLSHFAGTISRIFGLYCLFFNFFLLSSKQLASVFPELPLKGRTWIILHEWNNVIETVSKTFPILIRSNFFRFCN